jgi:putative (di)nucleoside polyphosphate hydrolase
MKDAFFRASAGAMVTDGTGRVLVLSRRGLADAWQMPQGGIGAGETPREAVLRELREETGLEAEEVVLVAEHPGWLVYELPVEWRNPKVGWGQAQRWFLLRARPGARVRPDGDEFDVFDWLLPDEVVERAVAFRRKVYEQVVAAFRGHL